MDGWMWLPPPALNILWRREFCPAHHVELHRSGRCQAEGVFVHLHGLGFSTWGRRKSGVVCCICCMRSVILVEKKIMHQDKTIPSRNLMDFGGLPLILKRRQPNITALGAQPNHSWVAARSSQPDSIYHCVTKFRRSKNTSNILEPIGVSFILIPFLLGGFQRTPNGDFRKWGYPQSSSILKGFSMK